MDTAFCIEAVEEALAKHGKPDISARCSHRRDNSDQGSQFTSVAFTDLLKKHEIAISMDGKGSEGRRDNVFVERLWRTIEYEESTGLRQRAGGKGLARPIHRPLLRPKTHSSLDRKTPDEAYFNALSPIPMAA
jgi:putative transposase